MIRHARRVLLLAVLLLMPAIVSPQAGAQSPCVIVHVRSNPERDKPWDAVVPHAARQFTYFDREHGVGYTGPVPASAPCVPLPSRAIP